MISFLTSAPPMDEETYAFTDENGFISEMRSALKKDSRALFICSDPRSIDRTETHAAKITESFQRSGIRLWRAILDGRNTEHAAELVQSAELIVLMGGHVPTQNRFFAETGLRELLAGYDGVIMGISAGSMNCAETVYAHPELDGEAVDPNYERFLQGLGLTKTMILPHYQEIKDDVLDGLRVFEEIAYPDSMGRRFYALVDGSYLLVKDGKEELRGEAYLIEDGRLTNISSVGDIIKMN